MIRIAAFLVVVCGCAGLLVAVLIIYFAVRYRRRPGDLPPPHIPGSAPLEWFWTVTPFGFFMAFFAWGAVIYFDAYRAPDNATLQRTTAFSPIFLTDGIQLADDPLISLRGAVYALSVARRR